MFKENHLELIKSYHYLLYNSDLKWLQEFFYHNMGEIRVFHENIVKLLDRVEMQREEQSFSIEYFDQIKFWKRNFPWETNTIPRMEPKEET